MEKKSILFIINPKSGTSGKHPIPELIADQLNMDVYSYSAVTTEYAGHASELARKAAEDGFYAVVAVGGDGTVNEVARALIGSETALGILPCGSGNGLARHIGVPMNLRKAVEYINRAEVTKVDYGKINGIPFFCTCGMGFDALVSKSFSEGRHRGYIGYITQTLQEYLTYKPDVYEIEDEHGTIKEKAFLIACGNAAQYGNNYYIAPHASMKDGLLNVTILKPFLPVDVPIIVGQVLGDRIDRNSHIKTFSSRKIKIRRSGPGVVHFDGEPVEMGPEVEVEIVPDGLNVLGLHDWEGTYVPVPIHKRILEIVEG